MLEAKGPIRMLDDYFNMYQKCPSAHSYTYLASSLLPSLPIFTDALPQALVCT